MTDPVNPPENPSTLPNQNKQNKSLISLDFLVWLLFNIVFGLLPFILQSLMLVSSENSLNFYGILTKIFSKGELLFIIPAISSDAIGSIIIKNSNNQGSVFKIFSGFLCLFSLALTSVWAASISNYQNNSKPLNDDFIVQASLVIFIITLVASAFCKLVSEREVK